MRPAAVVLSALLLSSCASEPRLFGVSEFNAVSESSYDFEVTEQSPGNTAAGHFVRSGDRLKLSYRRGETVDLVNSEGCYSETCAKYWAIGYWPHKDSFLIGVWYYEDPSTLIIDRNNNRLELIGLPVHTPDTSQFVAFNDGCRVGDIEVQVGKWSGDSPQLEYESFDDDAFPRHITDDLTIAGVRWISSDALEFRMSSDCKARRTQQGSLVGTRLPDGRWRWIFHRARKAGEE